MHINDPDAQTLLGTISSTLTTSTSSAPWSPSITSQNDRSQGAPPTSYNSQSVPIVININSSTGSTGKGILIGILSAFGSAGVAVLVLAILFFFRYTQRGKIILDRIGRPGEYDDEQAFAREEAEALESMDELQRTEYLRAKGSNCLVICWEKS